MSSSEVSSLSILCPHCAEPIKAKAQVCKHCRQSVVEPKGAGVNLIGRLAPPKGAPLFVRLRFVHVACVAGVTLLGAVALSKSSATVALFSLFATLFALYFLGWIFRFLFRDHTGKASRVEDLRSLAELFSFALLAEVVTGFWFGFASAVLDYSGSSTKAVFLLSMTMLASLAFCALIASLVLGVVAVASREVRS